MVSISKWIRLSRDSHRSEQQPSPGLPSGSSRSSATPVRPARNRSQTAAGWLDRPGIDSSIFLQDASKTLGDGDITVERPALSLNDPPPADSGDDSGYNPYDTGRLFARKLGS